MAHAQQYTHDRWLRVMTIARARWDRLTDDDLADVRGNAERLIDALQRRYGLARGPALAEVAAWRTSLRAGQAAS